MLVDDWERLFSPAILSCGYDYFADDRITRLKALSDGWEATASGSMDYSVFIDEGLERASCTCPYFADHGPYKHVAATCYEIEYQASFDSTRDNRNRPEIDLAELAASLDERTRFEFLLEALEGNARLKSRFIRLFADSTLSDLKSDFLQGAYEIVRANGYRGFVDWRSASRCEAELRRFTSEFLDPLIRRGSYSHAFAITAALALLLQRIAIDDSDGFFDGMMDACESHWKRLFESGDDPLKREMFEWMSSFVKDELETNEDEADIRWYLKERTEQFIVESFSEDGRYTCELESLADRLVESDDSICRVYANGSFYERPSEKAIRWGLVKMRCMEASGEPDEAVEAYALGFPACLEIIQPLVDKARKHDSEKALALLKQCKSRMQDKQYPTEVSLQLFELLKEAGRTDEAREELLDLAAHGRATDNQQFRSWFRQLKKLSGTRWSKYEKSLAAAFEDSPHKLYELYAEAGAHERLLAALEQSGSRYDFDRYRNVLAQHYPEKYLAVYERDIKETLFGQPQPRKIYRGQVFLMLEMQKISGGEEAVSRLVCDLKEAYPQRRALMEELKRLE